MKNMAERSVQVTDGSPSRYLSFDEDDEEFLGQGEVEVISTSAKKAGTYLSRLIYEKDWLDTLFSLYDVGESGKVHVSKLMQVIKYTKNGDFDELEMMLDPLGCDILVDAETFRSVMLDWEGKQSSSTYSSGVYSESAFSSPRDCIQSFDFTEFTLKFSDTNCAQGDYKIDPFILETDNAQLKYKNRQLTEENSKLESQILSVEETNNHLSSEIENLQNKIQSLQNSLQECQDEYYSGLSKSEEEINILRNERDQLVCEKNNLEMQMKTLKNELSQTIEELIDLRTNEDKFRTTAEEQEKIVISILNQHNSLEEQLHQMTEECHQYKERLLEILQSNEDLRQDKRELEEEVLKLHELFCLNEVNKFHENNTEDKFEENLNTDGDLDTTLENVSVVKKSFYTSDNENSSLYLELMESLSDESISSQPLCGKFPENISEISDKQLWQKIPNGDIPKDNLLKILHALKSVNAGFRESAQLFEAEIKKSEKAVETSEHFHHDSNLLSITDETTQKLEKTGVWNNEIITGNEQTNFFSPELQQIISTESLQDQINKELKMLRIQVARNQLLLSSLQSKSGKISFAAASEEKNNHSSYMPIADDVAVDELTSERNVHWNTQMNFSLHSKTKGLQRYSSRATSSSQSSTPQHFHSRSRSCPILPSQTSFVTKGTQTEPLNTVDHSQNPPNTIQLCHSNMAQVLLQQTPITSIADNREHSSSVEDEISLSSSPALLMLRNRSYSFAQAITQTLRSRNDSATETNTVVESNNLQKHSSHNSSSANIYVTQVPSTSSSASSSSSAEESEDIRLTVSPSKLSVLEEEEHEDLEFSFNKSMPASTALSTPQTTHISLLSTMRPLETSIKYSVTNLASSCKMHSTVFSTRIPPPYKPPPPPLEAPAYSSVESFSYSTYPLQHPYSSKSFEYIPPYGSVGLEIPSNVSERTRMMCPIRQSSDPFPCNSDETQSSYLHPKNSQYLTVPPNYSVSAQSLDYYGPSVRSAWPAHCISIKDAYHVAPIMRSSSDPTTTPYPPHYRHPPAYIHRSSPIITQESHVYENTIATTAVSLIRHNQDTNESSPKKKDITECPSSERQRKTGLATVTQEPPKMIVTSEHVMSRHEGKKDNDDDNEDDSNRRPLSRLGSRRRRRSFGSPTISPAIQRSKAVDFDFDVTDDQLYSLSNSPSTKKDDSDLDIKRDILEGMTQAANYASRCSATSTTETITTSTPVTVSSVTTSRNSDVHEHKLRRRTGDSTKSRLLMPDLMENSETESAKNSGGSMESEAEPTLATTTESSVIMPPPPSGDGAFPSLPDIFLQKLELHSSVKERSEPLTDSEIEIKFNSLCLAFKTDRFTLTSRLELHQRQRDLAEKNITDEINALKENLNVLSQLCSNEESRELMKRLYRHLEVLVKSTTRISSKAELYGAVQQEERTNRAVEAMLMYVENLKRINEKTTTEVAELKRILADNNLLPEEGIESEDGRRSRTYSVSSIGIGKPSSRRRASIAALPRSSAEKVDGKTKFAAFVANAASRNSICNIGGRRCSLLPNLRPFSNSDRLNSSDKIKKPFMDDYQLNSSTNNNNSEALEQDVAIREGNSQNHSTVLANVKSDSPAQAPLPLDHLSPVASSSSPSNGNIQLSNAAVTTNVEKRKTALYLNDECQENGNIGFENSPLQVSSNWSQTKLTNTSYMTDASEQDDEDDADIDDRNRIQPEFSSPVIQSSPYAAAASLLDVNHWVQDRVQIISSIRYVLGGMLFLAAIFSLVFTFMPSSTVAAFQCQTSSWNTVEELFRPYLVLHHQARPPM